MSVSYEFRERFSTTAASVRYSEAQQAKWIIQRQFALLFAKQLCIVNGQSDVYVQKFHIELDGETVVKTGDELSTMTGDIQRAISGISDAKQINIDITYNYTWRLSDDHLAIGPFVLVDYLQECDDAVFNSLDYVMYNFSDSSGANTGLLVAYGKRNNLVFRGIVEPSRTQGLPRFGKWLAPMTVLMIDEAEVPECSSARVRQICASLMDMSDSDDFFLEDNRLTYYMNNAFLETGAQLKEFVTCVSDLLSLLHTPTADSTCALGVNAGFIDISSTGPNILHINIDAKGETEVLTALWHSKEVG